MIRPRLAITLLLLTAAGPASAQEPYTLASPVKNLATIFTGLFGPQGLKVDSEATLPGEQQHSAHFNADFHSNFDKLTTALIGQLVTVPIASPSSGFTYQFDPALGVFQRTTQSFGPILAERADTIGAGRMSVGFVLQRFTFDTVEGLDLGQVPAVFTHDDAERRGGREDVVTTTSDIIANVTQYTTFLTVGITDRFDIGTAIKLVTNDVHVTSTAMIQRIGTTNPLTHFFRQSDGSVGSERVFAAASRVTGIGDITVRFKSRLSHGGTTAMAGGVDVRLPTGDQMNLLGTGAAGVQPFFVMSRAYDRVSPHLNVSYQWNGTSILAGNPETGESGNFPDQVGYAAGADVTVNPRLTLAVDIIGRYYIDAQRLRREEFHALNGTSRFANISFARDSFNTLSGSTGLKINVRDRLLLDANLLFALDEHGVRDHVTPLVALEYSF
jgi:hypothetical protein